VCQTAQNDNDVGRCGSARAPCSGNTDCDAGDTCAAGTCGTTRLRCDDSADCAAIVANDVCVADVVANAAQYANVALESPADPLVLPCGRYLLTSVNQSSLAIRATGRSVLFVDGDLLARSLSISVDPGAEIDIFVKGSLRAETSTVLGDAARPAAVRLYVGQAVSFSAQATVNANLYAPRADLVFGAAATVHGALFVNRLTIAGNTNFHYDLAVREAGTGGSGCRSDDDCCPDETCRPSAVANQPNECVPACSQCDDPVCGTQACVAVNANGRGVCGECASAADCCAGEVCEAPAAGQPRVCTEPSCACPRTPDSPSSCFDCVSNDDCCGSFEFCIDGRCVEQ
jgi:hypothetical protein